MQHKLAKIHYIWHFCFHFGHQSHNRARILDLIFLCKYNMPKHIIFGISVPQGAYNVHHGARNGSMYALCGVAVTQCIFKFIHKFALRTLCSVG